MTSLLWLVFLLSWPLYAAGMKECILKNNTEAILTEGCTHVINGYNDYLFDISSEHAEKFKKWMEIVESINIYGLYISNVSLEKISFPKLRVLQTKRSLLINSNTKLKNLEMEAIEILEASEVSIYDNDNLTSLKIKVDELRCNSLYFQGNNQFEELDFSEIKKWKMERRGIIGHNKALKSIKFADEIEELNIKDLTIRFNPKLTTIVFPLCIKAKENECTPLYIHQFYLKDNPALEDIRIKNIKGQYSNITNSPNLQGEVIDKVRRTFEITDFDNTRSCIPPNPIKKLDAMNEEKPCDLLIGEIQLAEDTTEDSKSCRFREIHGNLTIGKLEIDKFYCLKNVTVKGDIFCIRPNQIKNWEILNRCTVIEGDLKFANKIEGKASCKINKIQGNLVLQSLELEKSNCLKNAKVGEKISCAPSGPVANLDALKGCQIVAGDLQLAQNFTESDSCPFSEIQGNLIIGKLEAKKLKCLRNATVKGEITCLRPDSLSNWEKLAHCKVIEGDLKLDGNITGDVSSCSIATIRGNLSLGVLEKEKLNCLKMTKVAGVISCVRSKLVTDWNNLSSCQIIEGDLQMAENITGNSSCSISEIQGNLTLGSLEMERVACLKNATIKGQLSSSNCDFDYLLFPNAKSNAPFLDCHFLLDPSSAETQIGGDSTEGNTGLAVAIAIFIIVILLLIIGAVFFRVIRMKQAKSGGAKKKSKTTPRKEVSQKTTDLSCIASSILEQEKTE